MKFGSASGASVATSETPRFFLRRASRGAFRGGAKKLTETTRRTRRPDVGPGGATLSARRVPGGGAGFSPKSYRGGARSETTGCRFSEIQAFRFPESGPSETFDERQLPTRRRHSDLKVQGLLRAQSGQFL